jgi:hypothetical protein
MSDEAGRGGVERWGSFQSEFKIQVWRGLKNWMLLIRSGVREFALILELEL